MYNRRTSKNGHSKLSASRFSIYSGIPS